MLIYTFLVTAFSQYKKYMIFLISLSKFSDVLPVFTCANDIGNLWSICLEINILIRLPFCCLLSSRIISAILTIFFEFSISGIYSLII